MIKEISQMAMHGGNKRVIEVNYVMDRGIGRRLSCRRRGDVIREKRWHRRRHCKCVCDCASESESDFWKTWGSASVDFSLKSVIYNFFVLKFEKINNKNKKKMKWGYLYFHFCLFVLLYI